MKRFKRAARTKKLLLAAKTAFVISAVYLFAIYALAFLPRDNLIGSRCLPLHLKNKLHEDYPRPLRWIPFSATSGCFVEPPTFVFGRNSAWREARNGTAGPAPVPQPGDWQFSLIQQKKGWPLYIPYFALTTKNRLHFRVGARWDDIDHYYVFPSIAIKKIKNPG